MNHSYARRRRLALVAVCAAFAAMTFACTARREEPPKTPLGSTVGMDSAKAVEAAHALLGPGAKAALDSGNTLFRKKAYAAALAQYQAASELAPQHVAPLFGIYMVGRATNNQVMSDSALAGIRLRSGSMSPAPHTFADSGLQRMHENLKRRPSAG